MVENRRLKSNPVGKNGCALLGLLHIRILLDFLDNIPLGIEPTGRICGYSPSSHWINTKPLEAAILVGCDAEGISDFTGISRALVYGDFVATAGERDGGCWATDPRSDDDDIERRHAERRRYRTPARTFFETLHIALLV